MIPAPERIGGIDFVYEEDRSLPLVSLSIDFLVGTETDPPGKGGALSLAARLLARGTAARARDEFNRAVERLGADVDVTAAHHRVSVSASMLAESFDEAAGLLREMLRTPGLRREELEKLRRQTVADIVESREDDQTTAHLGLRRLLFAGHPYGRRSAGRRAELEELGYGETVALLPSLLGRSRVTVGGAGDVPRDAFVEKLRWVLDGVSTLELPPSDVAEPPAPEGLVIRLVDKPDRTQSQVFLGHLAPHPRDEGYFPMLVVTTAFGGTFTARLSDEIRRKRGMSYGAYARLARSRRRDAFYLWTFPAAEKTAECIRIELEMLRELREKGITAEELDFARGYLANHFLFSVETAPQRVNLAMRELEQDLPPGHFEGYRERVRSVGPQEASRAAASLVHPRDLRAAVLCTAGKTLPLLENELAEFSPAFEVVPFDDD